MPDIEVLNHDPEIKLPKVVSKDKVRSEILDAVKSFAGDQTVKGFIGDIFSTIAKERESGKEISLFGGIKIFANAVLLNTNFWLTLWNHGSKVFILLKCLAPSFYPEHGEVIKSPEFTEAISKNQEVQSFISDLAQHKEDLEKSIAYLMKLPLEDQSALLDQKFIKEFLDFVEKNKDKIKAEDLAKIGLLVGQRFQINFQNSQNKEDFLKKNNLKLAATGLEIASQFEGFEDLLSRKKEYIGSLICAEKIKDVEGFISPEDASKILVEVIKDKAIQDSLKEGKWIVDEMLKWPLNLMKVGAKEMRFAAERFPETLSVVGKYPEVALLQFFNSEEKNGQITYTLSDLGKQMITMGVIKLPEGQKVEEFEVKVPSKGNTKDVFSRDVLSKVDTELVKDFLPVVTNPEILKKLANVTQDLANDMPLFSYLPKIFEITQNNPEFGALLGKHAEQITEITKLAAEQQEAMKVNLKKFSLSPKFLEVTAKVLDPNSLKRLYEISVALGGDNNGDMTAEGIKWLRDNPDLIKFLQDPENQVEIANLVKACGNAADIPVVREYFDRPEFAPLKEVVDKGLIDTLPTIMAFLNPGFLDTLDKVMDNGQIVNGFMTLPIATNVEGRAKAEAASKELYFYLIENREWSDEKIKEKFSIFGIDNKDQLDEKIEEAKLNYTGIKLRNEINGIFKADFPEKTQFLGGEKEKYADTVKEIKGLEGSVIDTLLPSGTFESAKEALEVAKNEGKISDGNYRVLANKLDEISRNYATHVDQIKAKQASERSVVFNIVAQSETLEDAQEALKLAKNEGKISDGNYRVLADRLNKISPEKAREVFVRVIYEDQIRQIELLGVEKLDSGITVNKLPSDVIELIAKDVEKANVEKVTKAEFETLVNTVNVLTTEQKTTLVGACFAGKEEVSKKDLYGILRDGACRLKGGEGVGDLQTMLGSLLSPFVKVMKMPYGLNLNEVNKIIDEISKLSEVNLSIEQVKQIITDNSKSAKSEELLANLMGDNNEISREELNDKFSGFVIEYNSTISFVNKFMRSFNENEILSTGLLSITLRKGDLGHLDTKLFTKELLGVIVDLDPQERQAFNKLIPEILNGLNLPMLNAYGVAAVQKIITDLDKTKIDSLTGLLESLLSKSITDKAIAGVNVVWQNLGSLAGAGVNWLKGAILQESQEVVTVLITQLEEARKNNQPLDVRGLLNRNSNVLIGLKIEGNFTGAKFEGMNFTKSSFEGGSFVNSEFIKCNFAYSDLSKANFNGATFDLSSFESLVALAEEKGLDVSKLVEGAKVKINISRTPIDAKLAYGVKNYCKAAGLSFNPELLRTTQRYGIEYSDLELFTGKGWELVKNALGKSNIPSLSDMRNQLPHSNISRSIIISGIWEDNQPKKNPSIKEQLAKKGLTEELLERYLDEIKMGEIKERPYKKQPLEAIEALAVKGILSRVDSNIETKTLDKLAVIKSLDEQSQKVIAGVLLNVFPGGFKPLLESNYVHGEIPSLMSALSTNIEQIKDLNEQRVAELSEWLRENRGLNEKGLINASESYVKVINSDNYDKISSIASKLGITGKEKFDLYKQLSEKTSEQLDSYTKVLEDFSKKGDLNNFKDSDVNKILASYYLERAAGKMKTEEARGGKLGLIECLEKSVEYQDLIPQNREEFFEIIGEEQEEFVDLDPNAFYGNSIDIPSKLAKTVMAKLSGERYLTVGDRTSELEKLYLISRDIINGLPESDKNKFEGVIPEVAEQVYNKLRPISAFEALSPTNKYIPTNVNVEDLIANTIKKGGLVESVMKANAKHNKRRDELYSLNIEELRSLAVLEVVVQDEVLKYADRSKKSLSEIVAMKDVIVKAEESIKESPELIRNRDELYGLDTSVLEVIAKNPKEFAERSKVDVDPGTFYGTRENKDFHNQMYKLSAEQLNSVLEMSTEMFKQMKSYCLRSGKSIEEMMDHKDVLDNLEKLSKEFEDRYKLSGEVGSEKLCLNLVIKVYNTLQQETKALVNDSALHTLIADIGFNAIQREKLDAKNPTQVEDFATKVVSKINPEIHTAELAEDAIKQGKKIAQDVFKKLGVSGYLKDKTSESQDNFASIIASRIFASGKLVEEKDKKQLIGEYKPATGLKVFSGDQSTGLVGIFLKEYGTNFSYNYVNKFDKDKDRTSNLVKGLDGLIAGKSVSHLIK